MLKRANIQWSGKTLTNDAWEGGTVTETTASVNTNTGEVTNITIDTDDSLDVLVKQYIILNGEQVDVYDDEKDFDLWADIHGIYKNGVVMD